MPSLSVPLFDKTTGRFKPTDVNYKRRVDRKIIGSARNASCAPDCESLQEKDYASLVLFAYDLVGQGVKDKDLQYMVCEVLF